MAYTRLIVLVMAFEVLITVIVGFGIYYGFSVFPFMSSSVTPAGAAVQTSGIHATIPLYMPSLMDLKIPYTYLQAGAQAWGIAAFLVSAAVMGLQSFIRGMYLGGLRGWIVDRKRVSLLACGRRYFSTMLVWSIFQSLFGWLTVLFTAAFLPMGLILMIALLFYSLTPYLIVLQNSTFTEALAKAPRLFKRYFGSLLPLALFAMLCTLVISSFRSLAAPWSYGMPLLAHACVGTFLIGAVMRRLNEKLALDGEQVPDLTFSEIRDRRAIHVIVVLLVPVIAWAGVYSATGRHLGLIDIGHETRLDGISYHTDFSDVFYASEQRYTAYEWQSGEYRIAIKLPDLSGGERPDELRGIAEITWQLDQDIRTVYNNSVQTEVKPIGHKSRMMYRLVRETAQDGSSYFSSMGGGTTSILPGSERPREPLSVQMMVSGDGSQVFVLQYPARFDSSQVFRVSGNGQYFIPATSQMNPMDFHAYWFTAGKRSEKLFELLAAKNQLNFVSTMNRAYFALACAMQEGDGRMVANLLQTMRQAGISVKAPDWDEQKWTDNLHGRYKGASLQQTLELLSKAGIQRGYESTELLDRSDEQYGVYRFDVPFFHGSISVTYKEVKADGKLLSIEVTA
ncbi:hypothetical protein [Paenibacillus sp. R14(2021)]|uniref:hypothetical protein n=1 Tax=Paenibacillus sp. R14(2021) TaxID=2859228 RepID=UPI001C614C5A|nr:hypothetical protein [Paenibacillus sp. R14(2021)]